MHREDGELRNMTVHTEIPSVLSQEMRDQIERLLADPLFRHSKRYSLFIRHVVELASAGCSEPLNERALGVAIFERKPNYDTEADPIVRVTASEIRKRLTQYYADPKHSDEIRFHMQKGSYLPEFLPASTPEPCAVVESVPEAKPTSWLRAHYLHISLAVACLAIGALYWIVRPQPSALELFWAPLTNGPDTVLVSYPQISAENIHLEGGVADPQVSWADPLTPTPVPTGGSWSTLVGSLALQRDVSSACRISEFLGSRQKHVVAKGAHAITMSSLRDTPAVILGGFNNEWTARLLPQVRFSFDGTGTLRFIQDRQHPDGRQWNFDTMAPIKRAKDLIIITRVFDSPTGRAAVFVGGFSYWGTEAAIEFLTDPSYLKKALTGAPNHWDAKNLQIVLETIVVNNEAGVPRPLAIHYW
jgi:hypothetical protein